MDDNTSIACKATEALASIACILGRGDLATALSTGWTGDKMSEGEHAAMTVIDLVKESKAFNILHAAPTFDDRLAVIDRRIAAAAERAQATEERFAAISRYLRGDSKGQATANILDIASESLPDSEDK